MAEEKPKTQQATSRTSFINAEKLMESMRYVMTRPYGEVGKLMNSLSTLSPVKSNGGKDVGKK